MAKTISRNRIRDWLEQIRASQPVVAPSRDADGVVAFRPLSAEDDLVLDVQNTVVPPKDCFFPRSETLFTFDRLAHEPTVSEAVPGVQPWVLFGIRLCDAKARVLTDLLFDDGEKDPYYSARRDAATIVSILCIEPAMECFCESISKALSEPEGVDVLLTPIGEKFLVEPLTDKGAELLEQTGDLFAEASEEDLAARSEAVQRVAQMQEHVPAENVSGAAQRAVDETDYWEQISEACIGCGICTFLCPTCTCFDVMDDSIGPQGLRYRCWDSCQFAAFCLEASGHDPRPTQGLRQRQRVGHKLVFAVERFGRISCVGCGRCVRLCPVNIDIREIIEQIASRYAAS